mmetsp:Transcript_42204/g.83091  ORF Transcript_42204/g.83091 Transcript_42204/m.83091 type:complete len:264 (-) Transcript_42204:260-1051(-)
MRTSLLLLRRLMRLPTGRPTSCGEVWRKGASALRALSESSTSKWRNLSNSSSSSSRWRPSVYAAAATQTKVMVCSKNRGRSSIRLEPQTTGCRAATTTTMTVSRSLHLGLLLSRRCHRHRRQKQKRPHRLLLPPTIAARARHPHHHHRSRRPRWQPSNKKQRMPGLLHTTRTSKGSSGSKVGDRQARVEREEGHTRIQSMTRFQRKCFQRTNPATTGVVLTRTGGHSLTRRYRTSSLLLLLRRRRCQHRRQKIVEVLQHCDRR